MYDDAIRFLIHLKAFVTASRLSRLRCVKENKCTMYDRTSLYGITFLA